MKSIPSQPLIHLRTVLSCAEQIAAWAHNNSRPQRHRPRARALCQNAQSAVLSEFATTSPLSQSRIREPIDEFVNSPSEHATARQPRHALPAPSSAL